jgi:hypothetical protein
MHRSNEFHWQFPTKFVISVISVAKPKNIVIIAFTYVGKFCLGVWQFLHGFI